MKAANRRVVALLAGLLVAVAIAAVLLWPRAQPVLITGATGQVMGSGVAVFLTIENPGGPDRLIGARSSAAQAAMLMPAVGEAGFAIPAGATPSLAADGAHLMLTGIDGALDEGRLFPLTLIFAKGGEVATRARLTSREMDHDMDHALDPGATAPTIDMSVDPDGDSWVVSVTAENFTFREDLADGPHQPGTGHGHVYLGGLKLQRLYGPTVRIGALPPGRHELRISLNTNDHRPYLRDGASVEARATIEAR